MAKWKEGREGSGAILANALLPSILARSLVPFGRSRVVVVVIAADGQKMTADSLLAFAARRLLSNRGGGAGSQNVRVKTFMVSHHPFFI